MLKRLFSSLVFCLLIIRLAVVAQTPANYTNPLAINGADPHVMDNRARDGYFYIYVTDGYATTRYRSTNLVAWSGKGNAYNGSHAPHAVYWPVNNTYYLFGNFFRARSASAASTFTSIDNQFGFDQQWFDDVDGQHYVLFGGNNNPSGVVTVAAPNAPASRLVRPHFTPYSTWGAVYEGYWIHRWADDHYVLTMSIGPANGQTYRLVHATGPSPEGPFTLREWTADAAFLRRSEAEGIYGPGHHAMIEDDNGTQWVFYQQKDKPASGWDRKIAVDPLWFDSTGYPHMRPTRGAARPGPGSPVATIWPLRLATATIQAESYDGSSVVMLASGGTGQVLTNTLPRAFAAYRNVDFGAAGAIAGFRASIASAQPYAATLEVRLGGVDGPVIALLPFTNTGGSNNYQTFSVPLNQSVTGSHDIVLVFGSGVPAAVTGNLDWFTFTTEVPAGSLNLPPVAVPDFIALVGGQIAELELLANDHDPDGDPVVQGGRMNLTSQAQADGTLRLIAPATMMGELQFSYSISDGRGGFATTDSILKIAPSPGAHRGDNALIVFEAEDYHQMYPVADTNIWGEDTALSGFAGRGYVTTADGGSTAGARDGSRLDYGLDIEVAGLYYVWARVAAGSGGAASDLSEIGVGVGAFDPTISSYVSMFDWSADPLQGTPAQTWHWVRMTAIQSLRAGLHRFSLLRREAGHRVDRFVLTTDPAYDPATMDNGRGPPASVPPAAARALALADGSVGVVATPASMPSLSLADSLLATATVGASYAERIRVQGLGRAITWTVGSGTLPAGLWLDNGGTLRGVPTDAGSYTCTITATDADGQSASLPLTIGVVSTGRILREVWWNIPGNTVPELTGHPRFGGPPNGIEYIDSLAPQIDQGDNFGVRIRGWLHPTVSGQYTFSFSSDNNSETWLGTTDSPASKVRIMGPGGSGTSSAIALVAGQRYYLEVLHKEGRFGDNLYVRWQPPGAASMTVIPGSALSPWLVAPPAPERLRALAVAPDRVDVLWGDVAPNETWIDVQRSDDDGTTWQLVVRLPGDAFTFIDRTVAPDAGYQYRVRAGNDVGVSAWSRPTAVTTLATQAAVPRVPQVYPAVIDGRLCLKFVREPDPRLEYAVWASSNLIEWGSTAIWTSSGAANTAGLVIVPDSELLGHTRFLRLSVAAP
jgi:hypothetical protein